MEQFLNTKYFNNTMSEYLTAAAIIVGTFIIFQILKRIFLARLKKAAWEKGAGWHKFVVKSINKFLAPALYLGTVYVAIESLSFGPKSDKVIQIIYSVAVFWYATRFCISAVDYFLDKYLVNVRGEDEGKRLRPLIALINFLAWIIGSLFLLDNLGFQVSAIVTGLGISGIAVALAAQALLGDLFSYFIIFFDKPFEIGDFIIFEGNAGTIEKIGIKSTRVRSLSGEQLIVSNSKLTNSFVHNFKRMERRRVVFKLGVTYQTKSDQLKAIPSLVKNIILKNDNTEFDRAHFQGYGDFSLNFEFVYYILSSDYVIYMDTQEKINLEIYDEFEKRGIEFAYPTQTLFLQKNS